MNKVWILVHTHKIVCVSYYLFTSEHSALLKAKEMLGLHQRDMIDDSIDENIRRTIKDLNEFNCTDSISIQEMEVIDHE